MESQPQNPEFRNNPENFHPCDSLSYPLIINSLQLGNVLSLDFFFKINFVKSFKIFLF